MNKIKGISLLLAVLLLTPFVIPGALALSTQSVSQQENSGMVISKTAALTDDGNYTITLEAYATGDKIITEEKKDIPADIVLVLDQSGSMGDAMSSEEAYSAYKDASNSDLFNQRFNSDYFLAPKNLYYPVDGGYVEMQVDRKPISDYVPFDSATKNRVYYQQQNNLYIKAADGQYQKVTVERSGRMIFDYTYTYSVNGQQIAQSNGPNTSPNFGSYGPIYHISQIYEYTYYYQLAGQNRVDIETSRGDNTVPNKIYYRYGTVNTSRLQALEAAVTTFANSVAQKAAGADGKLGTKDDVNHRVAVVGFASESGYGDNTELLSISGQNSGSVGVRYDEISEQNLVDVLQNMDTAPGQGMVQSAIKALAAQGATQADLGLDMANRIFQANPVTQGEKRSRVVVFFTDGSPTTQSGYEEAVANKAIEKASSIKKDGASVYAVGIFPGADATANGIAVENSSRQENQFMQDVSSNNGTPKDPSYYLSAADTDALNNIFKQISDQIEEGGSSTELNEETVIKDIIAPEFTLPKGAAASDITLETYHYVGENQWQANQDSMGAYAEIKGDEIAVTGFDFSEHYVGTVKDHENVSYRGDKLVISFVVQPQKGFLGGNNVYTNVSAGIFENNTADAPILTFERPQVNVPIPQVSVEAKDKNVYLMNDLTLEQLRSGTIVKVGDVELNLDPAVDNYGLEEWQISGVDISVRITDATGKVVNTDLTDLCQDTTYNVSVEVSPKEAALPTSSGEAAATQSESAKAAINVFTPELTYKDGQVYYGDTVPADFTANLTATNWKHSGTKADTATMGPAPQLTLLYTPDAAKIANNTINTKQSVAVNTQVKIGTSDVTHDTAFVHAACADKSCDWTEPEMGGMPAFLLHVKTCQLTIQKTGGADNEPYVFTVCKDGIEYSEITLVGNASETIYELPVGTYTVKEDTDWSWRFDADNGSGIELTRDTSAGSITCTNTKHKNYWLNGFSQVEKNIFDKAN